MEYRLAKNYNYTIPNIGSSNSSCWLNETNSTENEIQETVAAETAMWMFYLNVSELLPIFITG